MNSNGFIAERKLLYSLKGALDRRPFTIRLSAPTQVEETASAFRLDKGAAVCTVALAGLEEGGFDVHGIDQIHAIAQAADVDGYLRGLTAKYDFYWLTGEPYFEDA